MKKVALVFYILRSLVCVLGHLDHPYEVECPNYPLIREAKNELCWEEKLYLQENLKHTSKHLTQFLKSLNHSMFNERIIHYIERDRPRIGLAISGGGYRSMLTGTGFLQEMENIGLYNCLNYVSGLSGGSWVLMDLVLHNFEVKNLIKDWNLNDSLLRGIPEIDIKQRDIISGINQSEIFDGIRAVKRDYVEYEPDFNILKNGKKFSPLLKVKELILQSIRGRGKLTNTPQDKNTSIIDSFKNVQQIVKFYIELHHSVRPKRVQGFQISFTDYWGKALGKRLKGNILTSKPSSSFSDMARNSPSFMKFQAPIPVFIANCRNGLLKNVIFEFTPFEFGSWESMLRLFVKIPYLGSDIVGGESLKCSKGYDDLGYITATSSSVFNNVLLYIWGQVSKSSKETIKAMKIIMNTIGLTAENQIPKNEQRQPLETYYALYQNNPFYKFPNINNELTDKDYLYLVDGGEDGENIPLRTLLIPERQLDVAFIIDSSSDLNNFANGTKLKNVLKQLNKEHEVYEPLGPEFKLTDHPVAIGCETKYTKDGKTLPILIYNTNKDMVYPSNTSTFKITYSEEEALGMINNGRQIFTDNNNPNHNKCLGCLIIKRTLDRNKGNIEIPIECLDCYEQYCIS
ncbi:hypothetical protein Kpol_487p12 [Vanderwaltozyma polyspora DSM 70294]|uniref:Lysophospholipase n=1 Tax=Vanderwaltozyma polyspora (strain ATCC 22028 / DSM 70294 / BCRC 21397 / CBS 2163 / NBRC 10782 / NRRL Y-8283 / UCD 57-17) TaxID=436907 RepID=A7TQ87_VANPO|nr:uncharacterized protein Kpol_487p12 [Vanderwaltozyma polyspora DSM 70294]EDO15579.1 hypothetical protein Kpol_487p12 [Vanderwaltozyma polyspora DSM 70294]